MKIATRLAVIGSCLIGAQTTDIHLDHSQIITRQSANQIVYMPGLHSTPACRPDHHGFMTKEEVEKYIEQLLHKRCGAPSIGVMVKKSGVHGYKLPAPNDGYILPIVSISSDIFQFSSPYRWHTELHQVQYSIQVDRPVPVNMMPVGGTTLEKLLGANMATVPKLMHYFPQAFLHNKSILIQTREPNYLSVGWKAKGVQASHTNIYDLIAVFRMKPVSR